MRCGVTILEVQDEVWSTQPILQRLTQQGEVTTASFRTTKTKVYLHSECPESARLADLWVIDIDARVWSWRLSVPGVAP